MSDAWSDTWTLDQAWLEIDRKMSYKIINDEVKQQEWIWFEDLSKYGSCMCFNTRDAQQYIATTLQILLDNASVSGNVYTLTKRMEIQGNVGPYTETSWLRAYSDLSQFAEWGYEMIPAEEYTQVHTVDSYQRTFKNFLQAGVKFSHVLRIEEVDM